MSWGREGLVKLDLSQHLTMSMRNTRRQSVIGFKLIGD
jgi:hypothetical protein